MCAQLCGNAHHRGQKPARITLALAIGVNTDIQQIVAGLALYRKFNFARIGLRKRYYRAADGREDAVVLARDLSSHGLD